MSVFCRVLFSLFACLVLASCGSTHIASRASSGKPSATDATWFCIANAAWNGWNCAQDPALLQRPLPPPPGQDTGVAERPDAPVGASAVLSRMSADATGGRESEIVQGTEADAEPYWRRLAYQPGEDIALENLPTRFYAVQIIAMLSPQGLEEFRHEHHLDSMPAVRIESGGSIYHALLLGVYENRADASMAAASRPDSLRQIEPWIRSVGSLQDARRRAEQRMRVSGG